MEYGKALRTVLKETGVSQAELTRRLGLGSKTAYVSQLCNGKIKEKKHCRTPHLTENEIIAAFVRVMNKLTKDKGRDS